MSKPEHATQRLRTYFTDTIVLICSCAVAVLAAEGALRLKNRSMDNYDIEMWRYAKELKVKSANPDLGHEHLPSKSVVLQSVEMRTNELGLRGGPIRQDPPGHRRILFLGSSIVLGWGVKEDETLSARVEQALSKNDPTVEVLNAGIGNYNSPRYVELFLTHLASLNPTDIVVGYFLRDAETLDHGSGNWLLRNSELVATVWTAFQHSFGKVGSQDLVSHYQDAYKSDAPGFLAMKTALQKLSEYARQNKVRLYLAMIPDVHNLKNYGFLPIHKIMAGIASEDGYQFIDLYPALSQLTPEETWAMPGDPHPNALSHKKMADVIARSLDVRQPVRASL
jgi:hypothetical protein